MLDINLIRENPAAVRKNLGKRQNPELLSQFDELLELDKKWRSALQESSSLRQKRNELSRKINELLSQKKDASSLLQEAKFLPQKIKDLEKNLSEFEQKRISLLMRLPNLLHESVPFGKDESENKEIRKWGKAIKPKFELKHHGQLVQEKNLADFEKAAKISGTGFYALKNELALMQLSLQRFAVDELVKKGYSLIVPPLLMHRKPYEGVTSLDDFETMMYKIENEDLYLIATAEHPMIAMHSNQLLAEEELPIKWVGLSPCFRKEIGAHGLDERGFFRVHQFFKVEQIIICKPEDSWKYFDEILENAEQIYRKLGLPYRIVEVCTGDIGIVAAKKCDLEVWSPREQKYFETHSCSNCASYQAIRSNIKYKKSNSMEKEYVHTLNNTELADARTLRAIIENYQTEKGTIRVPKALQKYMNGLKEIPAKKQVKKAKATKAKKLPKKKKR